MRGAPPHLRELGPPAKYDHRVTEPSRVLLGDRASTDAGFERFRTRNGSYERILTDREGRHTTSVLAGYSGSDARPTSAHEAERAWLQSRVAPPCGASRTSLRAVDLDAIATRTYAANFPTAAALCRDVAALLPGRIGTRLTPGERLLTKQYPDVDVLVGGPPCQGHSDFNNRTRHSDDKNELYQTMVRAAEVLAPQHILIENVPGALNDRRAVVQRTADALDHLGYRVDMGIVDLSRLGVPQTRRRLVMLASLTRPVTPAEVVDRHRRDIRTVGWAIQDLANQSGDTLVDAPARSAPATRQRIDYLFEHGQFDLPDSQRPACHAGGGHSYKSIYGRLAWDRPAQTVTTGFYSMCMGRNVHPSQRRTLTAHEAARLQYIPDWFSFDGVTHRTALARMIGNAVPSRLSYAVALEWLR